MADAVTHLYNRRRERYRPRHSAPEDDDPHLQIDLDALLGYLLDNIRLVFICAALGIGLALGASAVLPAKYTASTEILIDPAELNVVRDNLLSTDTQQNAQILNVESKMRILISSNVLNKAIAQLELTSDPEYVAGFDIGKLLGLAGADTPRDLRALDTLLQQVTASRDERSFVVTMSVTTRDAAKSVRVSEAIVAAFRDELARADSNRANRAAQELSARLIQLKNDVTNAEEAMESFRRDNRLQLSGGELVSTISMTELNRQLAAARQRLAETRAFYDNLIVEMRDGVYTAAAANSPTLNALRNEYSDRLQDAETLSLSLGARHPTLIAARSRVETTRKLIATEMARIVENAKANTEQAAAVVEDLNRNAAAAQSNVAVDNAAEVRLRELRRDATTKAAIYEAFLARAKQMNERERINTTNIQVISEPSRPLTRSWPPRTLVLIIMGAALGISVGAVAAIWRGHLQARRWPELLFGR